MAKKVRFPLVMPDGAEVRSLEELKEHFDLEKVVEYYNTGTLLIWLENHYYFEEAEKICNLSSTEGDFVKQLCALLKVEMPEKELIGKLIDFPTVSAKISNKHFLIEGGYVSVTERGLSIILDDMDGGKIGIAEDRDGKYRVLRKDSADETFSIVEEFQNLNEAFHYVLSTYGAE